MPNAKPGNATFSFIGVGLLTSIENADPPIGGLLTEMFTACLTDASVAALARLAVNMIDAVPRIAAKHGFLGFSPDIFLFQLQCLITWPT
mgnify:CR=1 FL=1